MSGSTIDVRASVRSFARNSRARVASKLVPMLLVCAAVALTSGAAPASTQTYTYDALGRLTKVERSDGVTTTYALDPAGNRTNVTEGAATPALSASVSATNWRWYKVGSNNPIIQGNVVVTPSGGTGAGYTYAWSQVSGPDALATATAPTSASTKWTRSQQPPQETAFTYVWRCKVTDSSGAFVYTPNVYVTFEHTSPNLLSGDT